VVAHGKQMNANQARLALALAVFMMVSTAWAEDGISSSKIVFGQVAALEGPAQALGRGMRQGILAAFAAANRDGGISGRTLELQSVDDGYEPERAVDATKDFVARKNVFAFVGAIGTPTSKVAEPIAVAARVPFIGPFTGAEFLRDPYNQYVVNVRSSYFQEMEALIEHLTGDLGTSRIAVLYQDDAFGLAGLEGVQRALSKRNMSLVSAGSFRRNTTAIKSALLDIIKGQPEAIITVGPYKPVAAFIKLARQSNLDPVFTAMSFVGSDSLAAELGQQGTGVIVSQVVPFPLDRSLPVVVAYQRDLASVDAGAKPGFVSLEGYLVGRLVVDTLKRLSGPPTREGFLDAINLAPFDFGGVTLTYGPAKNQGSDQVYFTILQGDGTFKPVPRLTKLTAQ
jgi:ABC-type branched-subunit amino acid transport system substrate-binding protein